MSDKEFLQWIHNRLVLIHGEVEGADYMIRLRQIISEASEVNL